jgi:hypothetical protein
MPREVSDEEYNFLQGRRQVADFVESIYNDPALSKEAKALIKKKYPQIQIPDYDIEERINQRFSDDRKEREEEKRKVKEDEDNKKFTETRSRVQKEYGFTDEAMKDLEKFMAERNVLDYEVAAEYHVAKNPKQSEADTSDGLWHHQQQENFAEISKDPEGWARKEILGAIRKDEAAQKGGRY